MLMVSPPSVLDTPSTCAGWLCCWVQVGTFTLFQETYHKPTFAKMHVSGPKSDFNHRLLTQDRAFRGGIDDVGIGTLFGLHDYRCAARHNEPSLGALVPALCCLG